jgi:hypothetical protein
MATFIDTSAREPSYSLDGDVPAASGAATVWRSSAAISRE